MAIFFHIGNLRKTEDGKITFSYGFDKMNTNKILQRYSMIKNKNKKSLHVKTLFL